MKTHTEELRQPGVTRPLRTLHPLVTEEVEPSVRGSDEVRARIRAAGLCHSNLSVIDGDRPHPLPMALGHDADDEVLALDQVVSDLQIGDHVALVVVPGFGHAAPCGEGRPALREPAAAASAVGALLSGARRPTGGYYAAMNHRVGRSAFAEHDGVSRRSPFRLDPALPWDDAAMSGCALLTGAGAVVNTAWARVGRGPGRRSPSPAAKRSASRPSSAPWRPARSRSSRSTSRSAKRELSLSLGATAAFDDADPECADRVRVESGGSLDQRFAFSGESVDERAAPLDEIHEGCGRLRSLEAVRQVIVFE